MGASGYGRFDSCNRSSRPGLAPRRPDRRPCRLRASADAPGSVATSTRLIDAARSSAGRPNAEDWVEVIVVAAPHRADRCAPRPAAGHRGAPSTTTSAACAIATAGSPACSTRGPTSAVRPFTEIHVLDGRPTSHHRAGPGDPDRRRRCAQDQPDGSLCGRRPGRGRDDDQNYVSALYVALHAGLREAIAGRTADEILAARADLGRPSAARSPATSPGSASSCSASTFAM